MRTPGEYAEEIANDAIKSIGTFNGEVFSTRAEIHDYIVDAATAVVTDVINDCEFDHSFKTNEE